MPSDALSTAATWGPAVTGNVAVLGTAPALAGDAGSSLIAAGIGYALAGSGTGLYLSLNCEYASATAGTQVPLLADVDGGGFAVTGRGSACPDTGTVNTWEAEALPSFMQWQGNSWSSPACSAEETFTAWPAALSAVGYLAGASPADFTASDGTAGQPYVLAGLPASSGTAALAPSQGGEVPAGMMAGGGNAAAPGADQLLTGSGPGGETSPGAEVGGPSVDTEDGDLTLPDADVSVPGFGPDLDFARTYDAGLARQETVAGSPGPLGFGWTDNWASSLSTARTQAGNVYTIDGLATNTGQGGPATSAAVDYPGAVLWSGSDLYYADTSANRVEEVPGTSKTQWGIAMTAGDVYTIAGSDSGQEGASASGTPATSALLDRPAGIAMDSAGNLYIADTGNDRVLEIPPGTGDQRGVDPMTADDIYVIAGRTGEATVGDDNKLATQSNLDAPMGLHMGAGSSEDLYIADSGNSRIQEISATAQTEWGQSMTANYVYTVAGNSGGTSGISGDGGAATSGYLAFPDSVTVGGSGDMYIADTQNCRIQEVPAATGSQWGQSMTKYDMYTVAGRSTGDCTVGNDGKAATSSDLDGPSSVRDPNGNLYITDGNNNRVQEVADTSHTEFGQSMTQYYVYTIAGSSAGSSGYSGDGGAATSALMSHPADLFVGSSTNIYVADTTNNEIREISSSNADISDYAGGAGQLSQDGDGGSAVSAGLNMPYGIASDARGDVFIADTGGNRVQEISASSHTQFGITMKAGDVYTVAGQASGVPGTSGDGGRATNAYLTQPTSIAVDPSGNLYIADSINNRIQEVSAATGDISTFAGSAAGASGDSGSGGLATSALLSVPYAVTTDAAGDVFIAGNLTNQVQEVPAATGGGMTAGHIYTIAGSTAGTSGDTGDGGPATSARLSAPQGIAVDQAGNVYIADYANNRIQEIPAATGIQFGITMTQGDIYTIAGSATGAAGSGGDGGPAPQATLSGPGQIATDTAGDLYITDAGNNRVREIAAASGSQWGRQMTAGDIYNVAGSASGASGGTGEISGDGGPAAAALLNAPVGVGTDPSGDIYITNSLNNSLLEVTATATPLFATPPSLASGLTITQGDGSQVTFYPQANTGTCASPYAPAGDYCALPQDTGASLTYNAAASTWAYTSSPGFTQTYSWDGALISESDAAGDTLTISYLTPAPGTGNCPATAATCQTITAASGRSLVIGMNTAGLVSSVTDPMGRTWTYAYNTARQLTAATDPMGSTTTYTYGSGATGNPQLASDLLTITSPDAQPGGPDAGDDTTVTYDSAGQVTTQTDPMMGYQTSYSYCPDAADGKCLNTSTGTGLVTVTNPDNNTTVYDYQQGALAAYSTWTGGTALVSEDDYFPDTTAATSLNPSGGTLLDTATYDGDQNQSSYSYNTAGDPTQETTPGPSGTAAIATTAYTTTLDDASCGGTADESLTVTCAQDTGPAPVAPGQSITPPTTAPPIGLSYSLYDTDGNELYTTAGVYEPGATSAAYSQTTYQLFTGNSVTLPGTSSPVTCAATPPSPSLPCATINADGVTTQLAYDSGGDLVSSSTPDGNSGQLATTTYAYDSDGEQTSTMAPDGNLAGANSGNYTTVAAWNKDGQQTSVTQAGGAGATATPRTTSYGFDASGNQTTVTDPRGYTTTTAYNPDSEPTLVTDPDGNATLTCYDGDGDVTETVPPVGVSADSLTPGSCPAAYPAGYGDRLAADATTYTYDSAGNQTQMTTPAPAGQTGDETTTYSYDSDGNLTRITAPANSSGGSSQVTEDTYNGAGELASQTAAYGSSSAASTTTYCYDPDGDQTSVVAPNGNTSTTATCEAGAPWIISSNVYPQQAAYQTTYSYDSAGELVNATTPATAAATGGATTTYAWDPAGNQVTKTDPDGVTATTNYTPQNLPSSTSYSGSAAHTVAYTYDADGNQTGMSDGSGSSSYAWDPFDELTTATNGAGKTVSYGYDADGDTSTITYPLPASATWAASDAVSYGYDHADVLDSVTDFNGNQIAITNDDDGQPTSQVLGSTGDTISTSYDPAGNPSTIKLASSSATLQSFAYSDAPSGNILAETDTPATPDSPADYSYDAQGRVASLAPGTNAPLAYTFDASGNLTTLPTGATGTYDDGGELTKSSLSGTTTSYTYNADGQLLSAAQGSTTVAQANWNGAGQLTAYDDAAADMTAATYDGAGLRASAATSAATQLFTWNTTAPVPELLMDSENAYIYSTGQAPDEQVSLATGQVSYLNADSLGSVRGIISSSGTLVAATSYDAWGQPFAAGGLLSYTPFGYAGGYTDPTGLVYLIDRYYDPSTGQFLSLDPDVSQTHEPYGYAAGNPVNESDPDGASVPPGGGYSYPESSPYFQLDSWQDKEGTWIPVRKGNKKFGYNHYSIPHALPGLNIIGEAIMKGRKESYRDRKTHFNLVIEIYDYTLLKEEDVWWALDFKVGVQVAPILEDGMPKGVITAFCEGHLEACPAWVGYGNWGLVK